MILTFNRWSHEMYDAGHLLEAALAHHIYSTYVMSMSILSLSDKLLMFQLIRPDCWIQFCGTLSTYEENSVLRMDRKLGKYLHGAYIKRHI